MIAIREDGGQRSGALALITAHPLTVMQRPQDAEVGAIYTSNSNLTFVQSYCIPKPPKPSSPEITTLLLVCTSKLQSLSLISVDQPP